MDQQQHEHLIEACLLGGAIGEMIGYPVDRLTLADIVATNGGPITGPDLGTEVSDGTQLTLFTIEGIIRARLRQQDRGMADALGVMWRSYKRWGMTQGIEVPPDPDFDLSISWMLAQDELHRSAPLGQRIRRLVAEADSYPSVERPANRSDGSGAIMRVAPVGLCNAPTWAAQAAVWLAALTHGSQRAHAASAAYAVMVAALGAGAGLRDAVGLACNITSGTPGADPLPTALPRALQIGRDLDSVASSRAELGSGRTSLSALLHAVACVAATRDYRQAVLLAANHDAASATPTALTGQLAALRYGMDAIPAAWRAVCPVTDLIHTVASDWAGMLHGPQNFALVDKGYMTY